MAQSSNTVKFVYIPAGGSLPSQRDGNTIYFCVDDKKLYVGADLIADSVDVSITGAGNYISDAVFSDGALTLTKSTLPDVSGAMRFIGISSTEITDQGVEIPTIDGEPVTPESGDVVLYEGLEFVWDGSKWNQLGDESSYALKTLTVTAGNGLTGGGTLASDLTLTHYTPVSATTYYGDGGSLIKQLRVDDFGHIVSAEVSAIDDAIYSYISSFASESYVNDAVSGLVTSDEVSSIIGSMGLVDANYVSDAISNLVSSGYVSDVISTAIADLASIDYVTGAITSATSTLTSKTYVDNAISGLASKGYVDNSISGLASEDYVDNAISGFISTADLQPYIDSNEAAAPTVKAVWEATSQLLSFVDMAEGSADDEYITIVNKSSTVDGQLDVFYRHFGSIASDDVDPVTGSTVYDAISNFVSADYVSSAMSSLIESVVMTSDISAIFGELVPNNGDYLTSIRFVGCSAGDYFLTETASFGSITSTSSNAVTGSAVYSAISGFASEGYVDDAISNAGFASVGYVDEAISSAIPASFLLEVDTPAPPTGTYLYAIEASSNPLALIAVHHPFGSIASGDGELVTGGIIYSAISGLASEGYVDNAISSAVPTWTVI